MYVAPRPHVDDDPLFAVRLSSAAVVGFGLAILLQSPMPMLPPALIVGLMAGMRKAFDPKKAVGGPVAMIIMVILISGLVELARPMPLVLITLTGALCVLSYYIILSTGNPIGMLVAIVAVLMSVMRMSSAVMMDYMRDGFEMEASLHEMMSIGPKGKRLKVGQFFDDMGIDIDWLPVPEPYRVVVPGEGIDTVLHDGYEHMARDIDAACPGTGPAAAKAALTCSRI